MKTYLSVDLDYWKDNIDPMPFFKRIFRLGVPISLWVEHQDMLEDINSVRCDQLINVDYHDDLCEFEESKPTEADWTNYVKWRFGKEYIWRYPSYFECIQQSYGICDYRAHLHENPEKTGWDKIRYRVGLPKLTADIVKVGVCISPGWSSLDNIEEILKLLVSQKIPGKYSKKDIIHGNYPQNYAIMVKRIIGAVNVHKN